MTSSTTSIEERFAHLIRTVEDLSDTIARQDSEIARLTARVEMLLRREAERESDLTGGVIIGDERPPHY
ncbi:MAG: SlyX family protein [Rhodobacteraceae bacterium]|nr:SlyX family protein [Paracoccaceae bacterium]